MDAIKNSGTKQLLESFNITSIKFHVVGRKVQISPYNKIGSTYKQ